MCNKKELSFSIFMIYSLADKWKMSPAKVYKILNSTGILKNPDVVHSKKYLDFGRGFYITTFENQAKKWAVAE